MDKKVKSLIFALENLEDLIVPIEEVECYVIKRIHKNIQSYKGKDLLEITCCDEALVLLKPTAEEKSKSSFDFIDGKNKLPSERLFTRLEIWTDVVAINLEIEPENETKKPELMQIYVPWEDERNGQSNSLITTFWQKNEYLRGKGCFVIHIGKEKTLLEPYLEE